MARKAAAQASRQVQVCDTPYSFVPYGDGIIYAVVNWRSSRSAGVVAEIYAYAPEVVNRFPLPGPDWQLDAVTRLVHEGTLVPFGGTARALRGLYRVDEMRQAGTCNSHLLWLGEWFGSGNSVPRPKSHHVYSLYSVVDPRFRNRVSQRRTAEELFTLLQNPAWNASNFAGFDMSVIGFDNPEECRMRHGITSGAVVFDIGEAYRRNDW